MLAIHLICGRVDGGGLKGVRYDKDTETFRSGQWDLSEDQARSLVGGWLYLHATKGSHSEFGGRVIGWEPVRDETLARPERIVFLLKKRSEGTGQRWRGQVHAMAHSGGPVAAELPHELSSLEVR